MSTIFAVVLCASCCGLVALVGRVLRSGWVTLSRDIPTLVRFPFNLGQILLVNSRSSVNKKQTKIKDTAKLKLKSVNNCRERL